MLSRTWIIILDPACHFELVRIARRHRFFVALVTFGLILLGVVGINFLFISSRCPPSRREPL